MKYTKEQNRIYHLARYHRLKSKMHEYLGGKCVICGTSEKLEIHHKNPKQKSFTLASGWSKAWSTIISELSKCELRCKKHHKQTHAPKHGTISGYRNLHCRCDPCKLAWNTACKKWKSNYKGRSVSGKPSAFEADFGGSIPSRPTKQ